MGRKKEEKLLSRWYIYQRGWLKFFFFLSFIFFFWFSFLVFGFLLSRYSRGAWCFSFGGGWVGVEVHYTTWGKVLPSTGLQVHVTFFLLMRWEEGWKGMGGRAGERADGGVRTLFAENREPTEICHCWPRGGLFFCFYEVGWLVVLSYLTLPLSWVQVAAGTYICLI